MSANGRLTVLGGPALEAELAALLDEIGGRIRAVVPPHQLRAALLIGGYGRGEGGVLVEGGRERPHNNLDVLIVTTAVGRPFARRIKHRLDGALGPLAEQVGLGIDTGVVSDVEIALAPQRVMWCDVRAAHRVLVGDPSDVGRLFRRFTEPALDDVQALLVNRATLLVIDEVLLERAPPSAARDRAIVRHANKAVVGYGDAWLASRGRYHGSYLEKRARILAAPDAPPGLRARYDAAIDFRLRPSYEALDAQTLHEHVALRAELAPVHLAFEQHRLGRPGLAWSAQPSASWSDASRRASRSPRAWAGTLLRSLRGAGPAPRSLLTARDRLAVALPGVLYELPEAAPHAFAARALGLPEDVDRAALRSRYLACWGREADPNFASALGPLGLDVASLDAPIAGAA